MKIQRTIRIMAGIWMLLWILPRAWAGPPCSWVDLAWISSQAPLTPDAEIVFKKDRGGICEVVLAMEGRLVPVYAGKDFIVAGQMLRQQKDLTRDTLTSLSHVANRVRQEAEEKKALAAEERKTFLKNNIDTLSSLVSISLQPAGSTGAIYVITDPNCAHCKALLPELETAVFEADLALKVIFHPLLGPESEKIVAHTICSGYSYGDYRAMTGQEDLISCEKARDRIQKTRALFQSAGIGFVPMVVAQDGSWVVEGSNITEVRIRLGLAAHEQTSSPGEGCAPEAPPPVKE
ncbi:thioredoxin fold domain-containing protein [Desulfospira joergensenii]|uniref:thioredoxin fold domain-containing protein n=1 Tax=Desulfospira joergensenii TaxID=53329 RepID=UPI0003B628B5|nr:thioredoxin fold domain-containing protein [Desulfospira joergensenii]